MVNIKIQKKDLWLLSAIMVFLVGVAVVIAYSQPIPNPGHGGDEIIVNVGGNIKTFQESINDDSLTSVIAGTSPSNFGSITDQDQTGDEIWININSQEKTLQQAINDGDFLFLPTAYVNIDMWAQQVFRTWAEIYARVTVTENAPSGPTMVGVTVQGTWSGSWGGTVSGTTDVSGQVTWNTDWVGGGMWVTYTVNSITMGSDVYELNGTLSKSFRNPF